MRTLTQGDGEGDFRGASPMNMAFLDVMIRSV